MSDTPQINPFEDQRKQALELYDSMVKECHHWSSFIQRAIESYNPELQAQLSAKEQELKTVLEEIVEERKIRECEFIKLKEQHKAKVDEVTQYARFFEEEQKRADTLRAENERLKKIIESDKETHERAEYSLRKRCEDLEAALKKEQDRNMPNDAFKNLSQ